MIGIKPNSRSGQNRQMLPWNGSIYKKIRLSIFSSWFQSSDGGFIIALYSIVSLILLQGWFHELKYVSLFLLFCTSLLAKKINSFFLASLITTLFTLPLVTPNKYYFQEVIRSYEILELGYGEGYSIGYGVNLSNIFIVLSMMALGRELIKNALSGRFNFNYIRRSQLVVTAMVGFLVIGLGSTIKYSPYLLLSLIWLFQYTQLFLIALLIAYLFRYHRSKFILIFPMFFVMMLLQFGVSLWQFVQQTNTGLPLENFAGTSFASGLDENNAVYRVSGTLMFHNQLALISLILLCLFLPKAIIYNQKIYWIGSIMSLVNIILTQSRSAWLGVILISLLVIKYYGLLLIKRLRDFGVRKLLIYLCLSFFTLSYVLIPRVLLSFNAPYEGAGIPIRLRLLEEGFQAFIINPWIGYGVGTNEHVLHSLFPNGVMSVFPAAIHNGFFQLLIEIGLLGLGFLLLPFLIIIRIFTSGNFSQSSECKGFKFSYLSGVIGSSIYYTFLPHVGIIEFAFIGLILGVGLIGVTENV